MRKSAGSASLLQAREKGGTGFISVVANTGQVEGDTLVLSVVNSGDWVEPAESTSPGSSLANLRRRLDLLYGDRASLTLTPGETSVAVRICLPVVPPPQV